ncbi:MAG: hypothetical protein JZD41_05715, partial [Thermoproteus sp.]|nr:hypothetical protein [Thermoproteus sp.]
MERPESRRERSALEGDSVVGSSNSPSDYDGFDISREIPHQLHDPPPVRFVHKHERATPLHLIVERPEATKYLAEKGADLDMAEYAYNAVRASSFNGNRLHSRSAAAKYLYLLGGFAVEPVVSAALNEAIKSVADKIKEGKKLSAKDALLLYLGIVANDLIAVKAKAVLDEAIKTIFNKLKEGENLEIGDVSFLHLGIITDNLNAVKAKTALNEAIKLVIDKLKEGKNLEIEDIHLLYLGIITDNLNIVKTIPRHYY